METMTSRERWIAAINREPIDRLPFWPKLEPSYPRAQQPPFNSMSIEEIHRWIGSDNHYWLPPSVSEKRRSTGSRETNDGVLKKIVYETLHGEMRTVFRFDEASQAWHPIEFTVKEIEDIPRMIDWFSDAELGPDEDHIEESLLIADELGEKGVTAEDIGESPLMRFIEWLAGVENAHLMLFDAADQVEELFEAVHRYNCRRAEIAADRSPADLLYFTENTSTTLISPEQYRKYCLSCINDYGEIINNTDKFYILHMCGHLKKLLPDLALTEAKAFEAFTSPPVGNTRYKEGREICPHKCLIGGTNATIWLENPRNIIVELETDLAALQTLKGIVVTSAGVMPPLCRPETIKTVCDWVKEYPVF
jgi:hypothetical protein